MNLYLSISLIVSSFMIGILVGFNFNPNLNEIVDSMNIMDLGEYDKKYDLKFIDKMIAHHLSAIDMANQTINYTKRPEAKLLSENIISIQSKEVEMMYEYKKKWYNNTTKIDFKEEKINLGEFDEYFDMRFVNAMLDHHYNAINLARDAQRKSQRNEILNLAKDIVENQTKESILLENYRSQWYQVPFRM